MKIGLDFRMSHETGIGRYIRNILSQLSVLDTKNQYVVFLLSRNIDAFTLPPNFKKVAVDIRWHSVKEQLILPIYFYKENLDLLFVPNLNVPILYLKKIVITLHDLTVIRMKTGRASRMPYIFYLLKRLGVQLILFISVYRAKVIFTVSNFVKGEILDTYKISPRKILITPNAAEQHFLYANSQVDASGVLEKYGIKKPYIFYIGNAHPHKNLERLISAFELVSARHPEYMLVLGGKKDYFYERLAHEISSKPISKRITFTGFVDDLELPVLYKNAELFVNPSLYEGFGIQLLEAFSCGTKVACSNTTSLPEVGGNIAYYFNPRNIKNMASVIEACLKDSDPKRIEHGYLRAKEFSWKKSVEVIHQTFMKVAKG